MESPLFPVLAEIFKVHLEKNTHAGTREIYDTLEKICR